MRSIVQGTLQNDVMVPEELTAKEQRSLIQWHCAACYLAREEEPVLEEATEMYIKVASC